MTNSNNQFCTIYLVRHGETEFNVKEIMQGQTDSRLTENGVAQAKLRAEEFSTIDFAAIFSSDLFRAQHTAEILKLSRDLAVNTKKLFRERTFGEFDGKSIKEFREKNREMLEKLDTLEEKEKASFRFYQGYETDAEMSSRMLLGFREIAGAYPGKNVLVVSHGAAITSVLVHLGFAKLSELRHKVENLAYVKIETDGVEFFIRETRGVNIPENEAKAPL